MTEPSSTRLDLARRLQRMGVLVIAVNVVVLIFNVSRLDESWWSYFLAAINVFVIVVAVRVWAQCRAMTRNGPPPVRARGR